MRFRVFCSYASKDKKLLQELEAHLAPLRELLDTWHDGKLLAGDAWAKKIDERIEDADLFFLLLSPDFLQSEYCYEKELPRALARHDAGEARVIPILVRPVELQGTLLEKLQLLPGKKKAVTQWKNRDAAWVEVVRGIRAAAESFQRRRTQRTPTRGPKAPADAVQALVEGITELPNTLAHGIQNFLIHYVGTAALAGVPFGGRASALSELDRWLEDDAQPPYRLLLAPGGRGKSALLAHWVQKLAAREALDIAYYPVSVRFQTNLAEHLFQALGARLAFLRGKQIPSSPTTPTEVWRRLVVDALGSSPPPGRKLLLVIDGIDEAANLRLGPDLFPLASPPGLRILLSARETAGQSREQWLRDLRWTPPRLAALMELGSLERAGIADVLGQQRPPILVPWAAEALYRLTEGDPLLLGLYLEEIARHPEFLSGPERLEAIKPGLDGYFHGWWEEQRQLWGSDAPLRQEALQKLLYVLACALGPLGREDLRELLETGTGLTLDEALRPVARLTVGDGLSQGFAFTHPRLGQYFLDRLSQDERRRWADRFLAWGRRALDALERRHLKPEAVSPYLLRYYGAHLERAEQGPEAFRPLLDDVWRRAVKVRDPSYSGLLSDTERAREALRRSNLERLSRNQPPALSDEVRCGLVRSSIHALAQRLRPSLIQAFITTGRWSLELAHAYARNMTDAQARVDALLAIADCAPESQREPYLGEALDAALSIKKDILGHLQALEHISERVSDSLLSAFLKRIDAVEDLSDRIEMLAVLAVHQPPHIRQPLLEKARVLLDAVLPPSRKQYLKLKLDNAQAPAWRREWGGRSLGRKSRDNLRRPMELLEALARIAPGQKIDRDLESDLSGSWGEKAQRSVKPESLDRFDENTLVRLLEHARRLTDEQAQAYVLMMLAPRLSARLRPEAWRISQTLRKPELRAEVLVHLVPGMPEPDRAPAIADMEEMAFALSDGAKVLSTAGALAALLPEPSRTRELRSTWEARHIAQGLEGFYAQARFISRLPEADWDAALADIFENLPERLNITWDRLFLELGPAALPTLWQHFAEQTSAKEDEGLSVLETKTLEAVFPFIPEEWLGRAWRAALDPEHVEHTAELFRALGPRLDPKLQQDILDALRADPREGARILCLAGLGPSLAEPLVPQALELLQACKSPDRVIAFPELFPRLAGPQKVRFLADWIDVVHGLENTAHELGWVGLAKALGEVLPEEAIEQVYRITFVPTRLRFLIELMDSFPQVPELLIRTLLEEAAQDADSFRAHALVESANRAPEAMLPELESFAQQVTEADSRARGLAAVAPRLAPDRRNAYLQEAIQLALRNTDRYRLEEDPLPELVPKLAPLPKESLYELWSEALTRFSTRPRPEFLQQLQVLGPLLLALGGEEELVQVIKTILDVGRWWP